MTVLCLDIATKTGWALNVGNQVISGHAKWPVSKRKNNPQHVGHRYNEFKKLLTELKNAYQVTVVYYEFNPQVRGMKAVQTANKFLGVLFAWACHHDIQLFAVNNATLRKSYGNKFKKDEGKEYAIKCANLLYGKDVVSDDEADALMLLAYANKQGALI